MNAHIGQRIDRRYSELTQQEQRVADVILDHFDDLAIYNGAELARLANVSKATVTRLFRRLGFSSAREVKEHVRSLRAQGVPLPNSAGANDAPHGFVEHLAREHHNLQRATQSLAEGRYDEVIAYCAGARRIRIIGFRNSYPVALHLRQQLLHCRQEVSLIPQAGQSLGEELAGLEADDLVVVVGFRRRPQVFERLIEFLEQQPVPWVLIGDGTARRYAHQANVWLEVSVDSVSAFDSYAAAMSLVSLLANGLLHHQMQAGRMRIADIGDLYSALDELEESRQL